MSVQTPDFHIRPAALADLPALHALIERAYRGDDARAGWTHEADLIEGQRTDQASLQALIDDADERLMVALDGGAIVGCVQLSRAGVAKAYFGLLSVDPLRQADGLGRRLIAEAEARAVQVFDARVMELTVVSQRAELIAYYTRRGYQLTGERRPFPVPLTPPLELAVMTKALG